MSHWSEISAMLNQLDGFDDRILLVIRETGGTMTTLEMGDYLLGCGFFAHWHSACNVKASCSRLLKAGKIQAADHRACLVSGNGSSVWKAVDAEALPGWADGQ